MVTAVESPESFTETVTAFRAEVGICMTSDDRVFIARMSAGAFAAMMDPMVADVMTASDNGITAIIAATIR